MSSAHFTVVALIPSASRSLSESEIQPLFDVRATSTSPFPSDLFTVPDDRHLTGRRVALSKPDCNAIGNGSDATSEGDGTFPVGTSISHRDTQRQTVVDLMQLTRVIELGIDVDADGLADLNPSAHLLRWLLVWGKQRHHVHSDRAARAGCRAQRRRLWTIDGFRLSSLRPLIGSYLSSRVPSAIHPESAPITHIDGVPVLPPLFNESLQLRHQPPVVTTVPGAMEIQQVMESTEWVQQPNTTLAYARYLRQRPLEGRSARPVIVQFAIGDQVVPNPVATAVVRAGGLEDRLTLFRNDLAFAQNSTLEKNPHNFLVRRFALPAQPAIAIAAQEQIAVFFDSDGTLVLDPYAQLAGLFAIPVFEVPIVLPLPEVPGFIR